MPYEDPVCGHTVVTGPAGPEHHEIPDDEIPHEPAPACGCDPVRDTSSGHLVYLHQVDDGGWSDLYAD